MATTIGKLNFLVAADSSGVVTGLKAGEAAISKLKGSAGSITGSLGGFGGAGLGGLQSSLGSLTGSISALLGGLSAIGAVGWGIKLAASAESAAIKFEVLLRSGEKAQDMLKKLQALDLKTSFDYQQLRDGAEQLLIYGVNAEAVVPLLSRLGDISAGNSERLARLTYAFGQVAALGHLAGTELRQFTEAGLNPLNEIANRTGETMGELQKRMSEGGISVREVVQAIEDATNKGGAFYQLGERGSKTLEGRWSSLVSTTKLLATELGEKLMPTMKSLTEVGIGVVDWLRNMDAATMQANIKTLAMVAAFGAGIAIAPRIIAAVMGIARAFKAVATGSAIAQALGGPAGLATLAIGLGAAVVAGASINTMFNDMGVSAHEASEEVQSLIASVGGGGNTKGLSAALEETTTKLAAAKGKLDALTAENLAASWGIEASDSASSPMWGIDLSGEQAKIKEQRKSVQELEASVTALKSALATGKSVADLFAGNEAKAASLEILKLQLGILTDELKEARDTYTDLKAKAASGLDAPGLEEARKKFDDLTASVGTLQEKLNTGGIAGSLKNQLDFARANLDATTKSFADLQKQIESSRGKFTSAADRFTTSGQTAIAQSGQEGLIQASIEKMTSTLSAELKAIRAKEDEIKKAIEKQASEIVVKEARI